MKEKVSGLFGNNAELGNSTNVFESLPSLDVGSLFRGSSQRHTRNMSVSTISHFIEEGVRQISNRMLFQAGVKTQETLLCHANVLKSLTDPRCFTQVLSMTFPYLPD